MDLAKWSFASREGGAVNITQEQINAVAVGVALAIRHNSIGRVAAEYALAFDPDLAREVCANVANLFSVLSQESDDVLRRILDEAIALLNSETNSIVDGEKPPIN